MQILAQILSPRSVHADCAENCHASRNQPFSCAEVVCRVFFVFVRIVTEGVVQIVDSPSVRISSHGSGVGSDCLFVNDSVCDAEKRVALIVEAVRRCADSIGSNAIIVGHGVDVERDKRHDKADSQCHYSVVLVHNLYWFTRMQS